MMIRVVTSVSAYPFYNIRYVKLLEGISEKFSTTVVAGSRISDKTTIHARCRVLYVLPFIPRRIGYHISPYVSQFLINLLHPDLIWLFDLTTQLFPIMYGQPVILDIDDPDFSAKSWVKYMYYLHNRKISKIVVPTGMIKERLIKFYRLPEEKIVVIPSGVDLERFKHTPLPNEKIVLYYGTFASHRSIFLLKIIEEVCRKDKEVKFIVIGDVPRFFTKSLLSKGIINRVILPGFVSHDNLPTWLQMARVCLFPQDVSLGGRFSVKLFEYMAAGRPIVATNVDESWPVREAGSGLVVPVDPKSFSSAVIELLNDDALAKRLASRGVVYSKNYDWRFQISKYFNLIGQLTLQ